MGAWTAGAEELGKNVIEPWEGWRMEGMPAAVGSEGGKSSKQALLQRRRHAPTQQCAGSAA